MWRADTNVVFVVPVQFQFNFNFSQPSFVSISNYGSTRLLVEIPTLVWHLTMFGRSFTAIPNDSHHDLIMGNNSTTIRSAFNYTPISLTAAPATKSLTSSVTSLNLLYLQATSWLPPLSNLHSLCDFQPVILQSTLAGTSEKSLRQ